MQDRNAFKAGIFILLSVATIVGITVGVKGFERLLEPRNEYVVVFKLTDDVGGLATGSEVRVGGLKMGTVTDVSYETQEGKDGADNSAAVPLIRAQFVLPKRVKLRTDALVNVQASVVGSTANLNIDSVGAGEELKPGATLPGQPGTLAVVMASAKQIAPELLAAVKDVRTVTLPKVNTTVDSFKGTGDAATDLLKHVRGQIDPIIERYNTFAASGRVALDSMGSLLSDSKGDFRSTIANLSSATGSIKEKLPGILDKVDGTLSKVQTAIDEANAALVDVKEVASNTRSLTGSARDIVVNNRGKLDTMIASLKTAGDNLKNATAEIRRSPWRLLYKPGPGEMANLNLFDSARQFAEGASDLNDASLALRDALKNPSVKDEDVQKLVERLDKSFTNFKDVEDQLWKRVQP